MAEILFKELSYAIVGAAMEVHKQLGPGFLEAVSHAALAHEFTLRGIPFKQNVKLKVMYKGVLVGDYEADFIVDGKIVVELKSVTTLHPRHKAQAINYLAATGLQLAILLNFGTDSLEHERVIRQRSNSR